MWMGPGKLFLLYELSVGPNSPPYYQSGRAKFGCGEVKLVKAGERLMMFSQTGRRLRRLLTCAFRDTRPDEWSIRSRLVLTRD